MDREICKRILYIEFERDRPIGLGSTFADGHTHTRAHIFLNHLFTMW